jgi:hypothetical protein
MLSFQGTPVFIDNNVGLRSARSLTPKRWHKVRSSYAARVQKKWNARFGYEIEKGVVYTTPFGLVMSQETWNKLRTALQSKTRGH